MRIIEIKAFQFEELDSQTKEKVIEDNRTINVDKDFWWQDELHIYKNELDSLPKKFTIF